MTRSAVSPIVVAVLLLALAPGSHTAAVGAGGPGGTSAANPAPSWLDQVQRDIAEQEYRVSWHGAPVVREIEPSWQAPNRAHGFRTYFTPDGIRVVPRSETAPSWRWGLSLAGYGRGDGAVAGARWAAVAVAGLVPAGPRVEYRRGELTEFYENTERGLEQGFVLPAPPREAGGGAGAGEGAGAGPAHVDLALWGDLTPRIAEDGQAIDFVTSSGAPAVHYAGLKVTDARGTVLASRMEGFAGAGAAGGSVAGGIRLVVDDRDAAYPVTIDPVATSPAWTVQGVTAKDRLGIAAATAGDINADGYSDVIVGAMSYDGLDFFGIGKAYLYLGSASGLSLTSSWAMTGDQIGAVFGGAAATAGDVNGDGYSDVIIGARGYTNGESNEGRAYVYLGSSTGLSMTPIWTAEGDQANAQFGNSVATAGDVNGDGYSDVIVGAHEYANGELYEGRAYVYLGSSAGLSPTPVWIGEENWFNAQFGHQVSTAGDVNGDGYADIIVGAPYYGFPAESRGRAFVYLGSASGPSPVAAWTGEGEGQISRFGSSVSAAGDVNGDGYADVVVGSPNYGSPGPTGSEGRAYLYLGSASGLAASPAWIAQGNSVDAWLGASVSTAGDVNGDGFADVIIGAPAFTNGEAYEGRALIYLGSASGLASLPTWTMEGNQAMLCCNGFGLVVGPAGDVNGDGYADVIVSSPNQTNGAGVANAGRVSVYLGSPGGPATAPGWTASGGQLQAFLGGEVGTAGDVNGDGFADVIVSAFLYDNGETDEGRAYVYHGSATGLLTTPAWTAEGNQAFAQFGWSVGSAGDINGDGYSDVIVGAPGHDNGEIDEGRAYLYLGSAAGVLASPTWTREADQPGARFGDQVATAGDVDGDGYDEILVGAPSYDAGLTDVGRVYLYRGSPTGLTTFALGVLQNNQLGAQFGIAVASAGDVNRDGYADVLIGAETFDNGQNDEGRAYLYLGSSMGLDPTPAWFAESNETLAYMGSAVATAGDVNGDGYADVLIGARGHDGVFPNQGLVQLYLGTAGGLAPAPAWTMDLVQDYTGLGSTFGTAGDVNGDGFADVIVGAYGYSNETADEGAAFLYLGAASGLAAAPAWMQEGNTGYYYGNSVGTAGDVNGDGYADIIVGAPWFVDAVGFQEGQAFVYYGNGGAGVSLRPQQRRGDDSAPIAQGGRARNRDFRLAARGVSPFGRGRARLEWEVKPVGQAFDGTGLGRSAAWLDTGTGGAALNELLSGFNPGPRHWRARLLYDGATTPLAQRSRWFTMPWRGWSESHLSITTPLGGFVWVDYDGDGVRDPIEPLYPGIVVRLRLSGGAEIGATTTKNDGYYRFELPGSGPYDIEFQPACYWMTLKDQGDDLLDSDVEPTTGMIEDIAAPFSDLDGIRWSAGLAEGNGQAPPNLPVTIVGARPGAPQSADVTFDIQDPNEHLTNITGYHVYLSTNAAIPPAQWPRILYNYQDEDVATPGIQITHTVAPPLGGVQFFKVTTFDSACAVEGPR